VSDDGYESEDDFNPGEETLYDRVVALKDIVPPQTRSALVVNYARTKSWLEWGLGQAGNIAWIVSTSALLVGLPLALAIEDETRITQQEREMQMQSQGQQQVSYTYWGREDRC
jgi:import receptor subunit TOM22